MFKKDDQMHIEIREQPGTPDAIQIVKVSAGPSLSLIEADLKSPFKALEIARQASRVFGLQVINRVRAR